ncbi:MAG: hypothetical protein AAFU71_10715 [Cyanobacteria bacterium J06632_22]
MSNWGVCGGIWLDGALTIAKQITQALDTEVQLWLIDYLQQRYWQQALAPSSQIPPQTPQLLTTARHQLTRFVQPRLVWEVTLMQLADSII